jgi:hypothetical protein
VEWWTAEETTVAVDGKKNRPARFAYQPLVSIIFFSEQTSHQSVLLFSQNKSAPATSQTNKKM